MGMAVGVKRQAPLKIDPATDDLISQAAHFLGMTKKDFVAEAAKAYLEQRREEVRRGMIESMKLLDGSLTSTVAMLTGLSPERIEELGGTGDWGGLIMGSAADAAVPSRGSGPACSHGADNARSRRASAAGQGGRARSRRPPNAHE